MKYEKEILSTALRFDVPGNWIRAIITQESNWEQYALRYEPGYNYFYKIEEMAKKFSITVDTERQTQRLSWGLGQIMGALAREQGHIGPMGELFEPLINLNHIAQRLKDILKLTSKEDAVFGIYNGGNEAWHLFQATGKYPNQEYIDSVKRHLQTIETD
jgi:hypothetical protein